jgi:phage terminase large subunit-like protein
VKGLCPGKGLALPSPALAGLRIDPEKLANLDPAERELVAEELRVVEEAFKRNPLLGFQPHGKQGLFLQPEADGWFPYLRAFFGGNRSGKTTAAILYLLIQVCPDELLPPHLRPYKRWDGPIRARVVTPDLTSTLDGVIHEKIREWCPPELLKGGNFDRAFDKVQRVLKFKRGDWIQFNSSEQDREKLGGVALHMVIYDEEPRQEVRNECLTRLIDFDGEEIFALTPFSGMKWLFDEIYEPWERGVLDPRQARVVVVDMDDNPHLSENGKKRALAQYSGPEREARKSGRFVSFAGLIYPQFSHERHVIPALDRVPPGVEVFRAIDPGYRHLCAVLYMYLDSDDELVVFDEIGLQTATVKQVCDAMTKLDLRWGYQLPAGDTMPLRSNWNVIDPASKNRNGQTGRSDQQEFWDNGS